VRPVSNLVEKKMEVENLEIVLIGICAVCCLVFLMFGLVMLEGLVDKKLNSTSAVLRASVYGGYAVVFGSLLVCCVFGTASCYVRKTTSRATQPAPPEDSA
jgi:hypothetical protein